ncbi:MAG TPA: PAS domain S-box protein, partial [Acetobacteraceae bacterium]|nr:PAS domain S-box protein [Acetobacteraceae bacterium]
MIPPGAPTPPAADEGVPHRGTSWAGTRKRVLKLVLQRLRPFRSLPFWARYGIGTAAVLGFYALRQALGAELSGTPYLLFFVPIILISFVFDRGTGFYATILAAALASLVGGRQMLGAGVAVGLFVAIGLFCATLIEALRLTVEELSDSEEKLERYIAARERVEAALAETEARFRTAFELAAVGVALVGLDGRWLRVNPALCKMLGYTEAELMEKTFQDITHPDDVARDLEAVDKLLAGEIPEYSLEKRYICKHGSVLWILLSVALVRDAAGRPSYFISVVKNIAARKEAEAVLARDRAQLERLVEQRTAALMRAAEERRRAEEALRQGEKLQAVGQLTGGIAHDFNNFLQVIGGGVQLLRRPGLGEERRSVILDGMAKATQNAAELTGRLLAFARKQKLRPETFDLNARLESISGMVRHTLRERAELVMDLSADLWPVRVDPHQLDVAVLNLAANARDAMGEARGTLTLRTRNTVLGLGTERGEAGEYVELLIADDGEGMPPAVLARVFEPFFTTKGPNQGTGLGLAQVHGFVKQSGGDIALESAPGQGTRVTLRLPRADAEPVPEPVALEPEVTEMMGRAAGKSVLVVDDNAEVASFAATMLAELGYTTHRASDAAEALRVLASGNQVDAVFSDIVMPGPMNGVELAARLRDTHPRVAVVL